MNIVVVLIGGFIGAIFRYLSSFLLGKYMPQGRFPWIILAVNGLGCFIFGLFYSIVEGKLLSLFLFTGILGAFTTFSTFSIEAIQLWQKQEYLLFGIYMISTLIGGTFLFTLGYMIL